MEQRMEEEVLRMLQKRKRRKFWSKIVSVMMCLVVFCTTYALILPAITQQTDTFCGYEAHTHGEACFSKTLVCENHVHGENCFETHRELVCTIAETEGHTHTEACVAQTEQVLSCGMDEAEGHSHTEQCSVTELVLSCGLEESAEHAHTDACYTSQTTYVCGQEEWEGHQHTEACYTETTTYGCGQQEAEAHVHTDACFEVTQVQICTIETNPDHEHTENCYEKQRICQREEHEHSLICYADPGADLENASIWEASLPKTLSGIYPEDVLAIAESQLGYTESERNYTVSEAGEMKGYTRYGDWYGSPYGDWCAMFVSFCLDYAGVEKFPLDANCPNWICTLQQQNMYTEAEEYIPAAGDVIFFDWDADEDSDHVGIVAEYFPATETSAARVKTIEGNSGNAVQYNTYNLVDPTIMGYGRLPEQIFYCGMDAHTHDETCVDCQIEEHVHDAQCVHQKIAAAPLKSGAPMLMQTSGSVRTNDDITYHKDLESMLSKTVIAGTNPDTNETFIVYDSSTDEGTKEIILGDMYVVELTFSESNSDQFDPDQQQYVYTIPDYLISDRVDNGIIHDRNQEKVATYTIIGNQFTMTPIGDNFFAKYNDATFTIQFDAEAVFDSENTELQISFGENITVTLNTKEDGTLNNKKELVNYDKENRILTYKCTTTAHGGTVDLITISDWWWPEGDGAGSIEADDVIIIEDTITLQDESGNDVTGYWNYTIYSNNNNTDTLEMHPKEGQSYYLKHGESITLTYQVQLSEDLTKNFNYVNQYYNYGKAGEKELGQTATVNTPITFTNVEKSGAYVVEDVDGTPMDALEWEVEISNPEGKTITVTDQLQGNQTFCQHQPIQLKKIKADGTKEYSSVPWADVHFIDDKTIHFELPEGYVEYELTYYSHYVVDATSTELQNFENNIETLVDGSTIPNNGTGSVSVLGIPPGIDKQITATDDDYMTFSVECFIPAMMNNRESVLLYDSLTSWGATDGYVSNYPEDLTVTVAPVGADAYQLVPYEGQANPDGTYLLHYDGQDFTMYFNTSQPQGATSVWKCDVDSTLTISYKIPLDAMMLDGWGGDPTEETLRQFLERTGQGVDNYAQLNYSPKDYVSDGVHYDPPEEPVPPLNKTGTPVAEQDGVFEYSVWFSPCLEEGRLFSMKGEGKNTENIVDDLVLTDTFDSQMEYVPGSFKVTLWGIWGENSKEYYATYSLPEGTTPAFTTTDGKTQMTVSALSLIGNNENNPDYWLNNKSLLYAMKCLLEGHHYEFTYQLKVKDDVRNTSTEGVLYLDNSARIDWTEGNTPKSVGPANFEVAYDTGILDKTMLRPDDDSNRVNFSVMINPHALDLAPDSETYILHDTMSSNLTLLYKSLKIELLNEDGTVRETRTPEACNFTVDPDMNRMTFTMPDSTAIRLTYDCRVNGRGGAMVNVGNKVELEGYSTIQDVIDTMFEVRDHSGNADASSKSFTLQKQDGNTLQVLPEVSFELYGDTERAGSNKTITVGNKTLYYYQTFTTDANGHAEIADSQLSAGHMYALKEVTTPAGYLPLEEPYVFYMENRPLGGSMEIDVLAEGALLVIQNYPIGYELPETGGTGTQMYTTAGLLLMLTSTAFLMYKHRKRRKEVT